jgi:hypothetical protein
MTKKDIMDMLKISILFIIIAFTAFSIFFICRHETADIGSDQQVFERFADDVKTGKQQLTTDRAIAIIRQERVTVDLYRKVIAVEAWLVQWIGWMSLLGIGMQVFVAIRIRKRMKKP